MNGVALIVLSNMIIGTSLMALHDYRRASWIIASLGSFLLGVIVLWGPYNQPLVIGAITLKLNPILTLLGRRLILGGPNQYSVAFLYLAGAFLFGGGWIARPSRYFYSAGSFSLLAMVFSLMVDPFLYSAIFLEVAALAIIFVLIDLNQFSIQAAIRLLLFYTLGMMAILMAGWLLDTAGVTAGTPLLIERVSRFLVIGFGVFLMVPPFHLWMPVAADSCNKYSLIFSCTLLYSTGLFIILRYLNAFEWLRSSIIAAQGLQAAGLAMALVGGMWALAQRSLTRAMVFLLIIDFGATMTVLSMGQSDSYLLALLISGARIIGAGVWGIGVALLERVKMENTGLSGAAYSNPLPVAAVLVGMFSVGGIPLTAGFPGRWGGVQLIAEQAPIASIILILGIGLSAATALRWMGHFLSSQSEIPRSLALKPIERNTLFLGIGISIILGVFPQILSPWLSRGLIGLENLVK